MFRLKKTAFFSGFLMIFDQFLSLRLITPARCDSLVVGGFSTVAFHFP